MPTNVRFLRIAKKRLTRSTLSSDTRPSWTFSFTKAPRCLKLLIPASNAIGRWGIAVELSPVCPLNRNNWFVLHKLQHTKRLLLRSRHYRFVTSQTERRVEWDCACAQNLNTCCFVPCGKPTSPRVLIALMADWNRSNHFDTTCNMSHKTFVDWDDYSLADFEGICVSTWVVFSSVTQLLVHVERKLWQRPFWRGLRLLEMTLFSGHAQASQFRYISCCLQYAWLIGTRVALPMMHCKVSCVCDCSCCPNSMYCRKCESRGVETGEWGVQACGTPLPIQFS